MLSKHRELDTLSKDTCFLGSRLREREELLERLRAKRGKSNLQLGEDCTVEITRHDSRSNAQCCPLMLAGRYAGPSVRKRAAFLSRPSHHARSAMAKIRTKRCSSTSRAAF